MEDAVAFILVAVCVTGPRRENTAVVVVLFASDGKNGPPLRADKSVVIVKLGILRCQL